MNCSFGIQVYGNSTIYLLSPRNGEHRPWCESGALTPLRVADALNYA